MGRCSQHLGSTATAAMVSVFSCRDSHVLADLRVLTPDYAQTLRPCLGLLDFHACLSKVLESFLQFRHARPPAVCFAATSLYRHVLAQSDVSRHAYLCGTRGG